LCAADFIEDGWPAELQHALRILTVAMHRMSVRQVMVRFPALTVAAITMTEDDSRLVMHLAERHVTFRWTGFDSDAVEFSDCELVESALGWLREPPTSCEIDATVPRSLKATLDDEFARLPPPPPPRDIDVAGSTVAVTHRRQQRQHYRWR
jgi:hypothetical protein